MTTVDPIVQCAACGAKLRLKAASLKVLKQVRCGKCQAMIEIPESLKGDGPVSDVPVLAKAIAADTPVPTVVKAPTPVPVPASVPAPPPVPVSAPAPVPRPVAAPVPVPRVDAPPEARSPSPVCPQDEPLPSAPERMPSLSPARPSDPELVARVDLLELTVRAQQESISLLNAQLRQIVKAQATAAAAAQALLDR